MAILSYLKTVWKNNVSPAINEVNLNKVENQLKILTDEAIRLDGEVISNDSDINSRMTAHTTGVSEKHSTDDVIDNSSLPNATNQTAANDYLKLLISTILEGQDLDPNKDVEVLASRLSAYFGSFGTMNDRLDYSDSQIKAILDELYTQIEAEVELKDGTDIVTITDVGQYGSPTDVEIEGNTVNQVIQNRTAVANLGTESFDSIDGIYYFDVLNKTKIIGDGTTKIITNNSGASAIISVVVISSSENVLTTDQLYNKYSKSSSFVYGLNHVENPSVEQHGVNLADVENDKVIPAYLSSGVFRNNIATTGSILVKIEEGNQYSMLKTGGNRTDYAFFSDIPIADNTPSLSYGNALTTTIAPLGSKYLLWYVANAVDFPTEITIVEGNVVPTSHVVYEGSQLNTENLTLRSSNAKNDKLVNKNGKNVIEKNTSDNIVFDGSVDEGWGTSGVSNQVNTIAFGILNTSLKATSEAIINVKSTWFDNTQSNMLTVDSEMIALGTDGFIRVRILRSRLTTQNVAGFKTWLASNPIAGVFTLATPLVINEEDFAQNNIVVSGILQTTGGQQNTVYVEVDTFNESTTVTYARNLSTAFNDLIIVIKSIYDKLSLIMATLLDHETRITNLEP